VKTGWKVALGALAGAAGVAYGRAMTARNRAIERPPMRDTNGEPYRIETITFSDGAMTEYVDVGDGSPIVWIPGADGPKETFRYQFPHFAKRHRLISADLRDDIDGEHEFDRLIDDVEELLDALGIDRCVLVAQSFGCAIALGFAARSPERLDGLVLANPVARISYEHLGFNRTALVPVAQRTTRYLPTWLGRAVARSVWSPLSVWIFDDSPGREALIDYSLETGGRTVDPKVSGRRVALLKGHDLTEDLWRIPVPTLVVKGPYDMYCPVSWALEIADGLPDASYVPIPGTGHCSHVSRPGAFNQVLESWLDRRLESADRAALQAGLEPDGGVA
jgi:pimeloyl-ACP methyl ester carboxylesterase